MSDKTDGFRQACYYLHKFLGNAHLYGFLLLVYTIHVAIGIDNLSKESLIRFPVISLLASGQSC